MSIWRFSLTSQDKAKASFMRKQRTAGFMWSLTNTMTGMAIFICSADTLLKLAAGKLDPVFAFTTGKLKVEGSLEKALKLQKFV